MQKATRTATGPGFWQTQPLAGSKHPRLQLLTIEDRLAGQPIDMPTQQDVRSFKQAANAKSNDRLATRSKNAIASPGRWH